MPTGLTNIDVGWNRFDIAAIIAIAGTTISPYLFFWQAAEEVEASGQAPDTSQSHIRAMRGDVLVGMFSGVFVMFAIMTTTAATLNAEGITQITSPEQAAMALAPIAGDAAGIIFALGILGTGLLAVPVLAGSTAYAVSEAMGWRESLERKPSQAKQFYAVIAISMVIAVALNLMGINPMRSLVVAALLNGLTSPILMFIIWWLARDPLVIRARVGLCDYFELVSFQANGRTAPAATALIASPIKNGTTPFAIAQAIVLPVV